MNGITTQLKFEERVLEQCDVAKERVDLCSAEEFTMLRRQGLGASDSSVILGLHGAWKTKDEIVAEKLLDHVTEEERKIGEIVNVKKGRDLEPLILKKASEALHMGVIKPTTMYRLKTAPYLTINYDGVAMLDKDLIPIEAKFVSTYGDKYYDKEQAVTTAEILLRARNEKMNIRATIEEKAKRCGVPGYYYTQVQQQMMGLNSPFGILTALHDKTWELKMYFIPRDVELQQKILTEGYKLWMRVEKMRHITSRNQPSYHDSISYGDSID